jgi:hypothetical protein
MRLFEHPDFSMLIVAAAEQLGMPPHFVEKDYYERRPVAPRCLTQRAAAPAERAAVSKWEVQA